VSPPQHLRGSHDHLQSGLQVNHFGNLVNSKSELSLAKKSATPTPEKKIICQPRSDNHSQVHLKSLPKLTCDYHSQSDSSSSEWSKFKNYPQPPLRLPIDELQLQSPRMAMNYQKNMNGRPTLGAQQHNHHHMTQSNQNRTRMKSGSNKSEGSS